MDWKGLGTLGVAVAFAIAGGPALANVNAGLTPAPPSVASLAPIPIAQETLATVDAQAESSRAAQSPPFHHRQDRWVHSREHRDHIGKKAPKSATNTAAQAN
jgi:hypothetical protein